MDATYRSELRDLNDLNFQRFDAKLEQRVSQLDAKWDRRIAELDGKWERRFSTLEQSLARMDARLTWRLFLFWIGTLGTLIALLKL